MKEIYTNFKNNKQKIEVFLPHGEDAEKLYKAYEKELEKFPIKEWSSLKYNPETKEIFNANNIDQGIINYLLKDSELRVAVQEDNQFNDISNLIKGKYYAEFNELGVHPDKPSYEKNNGLWKKAMELGEESLGSIKSPFRIQGFYYVPDETEKSYGIKIISAPNFKIIQDENLQLDNGVSRVYLYGDDCLNSRNVFLAYSGGDGRVVLTKSRSDALENLEKK